MPLVCQVTGKKPMSGNRVSHANNRTKRKFNPNIQNKRFWLPSENRFVRLKVSAKGIKIITKLGIEKVVADMRRKGVKV
ncbi:MAG: 50S ribosomal protein L28 [Bryobacteraceae bacterium]|nr:50S ribosomal protein L28 [Bryobacteraceae bacterium]